MTIDTRKPKIVVGRNRPGYGSLHAVRVLPRRDGGYSEPPMTALCGVTCLSIDHSQRATDVILNGTRTDHCRRCIEAMRLCAGTANPTE